MTTPLKRVAIVGGTHGNETTGLFVVQHFLASPELVRRPSFETVTLISNEDAVRENTRYVDIDLNRCFLTNDLLNVDYAKNGCSREERRAREINVALGPKEAENPACDLVIDLHNTTANTGVALMVPPDDDFAHEIGAYLQNLDPSVRVVQWTPVKRTLSGDWGLLPSIGRSGMTFEVGGVPWGGVIGEKYEQSRVLLHAVLDYIHVHNRKVGSFVTSSGGGTRGQQSGSQGGSDHGGRHKEQREEVAIAWVHVPMGYIYYPRSREERKRWAQGGGGAAHPIIHPALQGRDFEELREGDPLFLALDGSTIPFKKSEHRVPEDWSVFPFFINEAAYYEGGVACVIAVRQQRRIGLWKVDEESRFQATKAKAKASL